MTIRLNLSEENIAVKKWPWFLDMHRNVPHVRNLECQSHVTLVSREGEN